MDRGSDWAINNWQGDSSSSSSDSWSSDFSSELEAVVCREGRFLRARWVGGYETLEIREMIEEHSAHAREVVRRFLEAEEEREREEEKKEKKNEGEARRELRGSEESEDALEQLWRTCNTCEKRWKLDSAHYFGPTEEGEFFLACKRCVVRCLCGYGLLDAEKYGYSRYEVVVEEEEWAEESEEENEKEEEGEMPVAFVSTEKGERNSPKYF